MLLKLKTSLIRLALIPLLIPLAAIADETGDAGPRVKSITGGTTQSHWSYTSTYKEADLQTYAARPNEKTLQTLIVEWDEIEFGALHRFCMVRGRLMLPGNETTPARPVDWFQGITLYMAKSSGANPDWTGGARVEDAVIQPAVVREGGKFSFYIETRNWDHETNLGQSFQVGLALAIHDGNKVSWTSQSPALPPTVKVLTTPAVNIPAIKQYPHEMDLINKAAYWGLAGFDHFNSVELIRAVNALHRLEKEESLTILEQFAESIHNYEHERIVFWIIRLLFEPTSPNERIPAPMIGVRLVQGNSPEAAEWPICPMALIEDIPFMLGHPISIGGSVERPSAHIKWAREHGKLRATPIKPMEQPLLAADKLLNSPQYRKLSEFNRKHATPLVRQQAQAMIEQLMPSPEITSWLYDDLEWKKHVEKSVALGIHWDNQRQEFIIDAK